jgi:hypothetical protein
MNPNHHLYLNNKGFWWISYTEADAEGKAPRRRLSLKVRTVEEARQKRDEILSRTTLTPHWKTRSKGAFEAANQSS